MNKHKFNPDYAVPPGETLAEWLSDHHHNTKMLSILTKLPVEVFDGIVSGNVAITPEYAEAIAECTGTRVSFWLNREASHRAALAKQKATA